MHNGRDAAELVFVHYARSWYSDYHSHIKAVQIWTLMYGDVILEGNCFLNGVLISFPQMGDKSFAVILLMNINNSCAVCAIFIIITAIRSCRVISRQPNAPTIFHLVISMLNEKPLNARAMKRDTRKRISSIDIYHRIIKRKQRYIRTTLFQQTKKEEDVKRREINRLTTREVCVKASLFRSELLNVQINSQRRTDYTMN